MPVDYYRRPDVVGLARQLLGKVLCSRIDGDTVRVVISETEAYAGEDDRASHAWNGRRTRRTEPMYAAGGVAYVYLCYGVHHLFNIVTAEEGVPHAVLVRAAVPMEGVDAILRRRGTRCPRQRLLVGPGNLSRAMGITTAHTAEPLTGPHIWLEDHAIDLASADISAGPRVGVDYAGPDAQLPYRFRARLAVKTAS